MTIRLSVLLSGRGSNFQAIHKAIQAGRLTDAEIVQVISNKQDAPGLAYAAQHRLLSLFVDPKAVDSKEAYDEALLEHLTNSQVDLVILAGYMKVITPVLLNAFPGRILNIHPSLLPAYGGYGMTGMKVHQAVIEGKEMQSGCTVHVVTEAIDGGPILGQATVPVTAEDDADSLAAKILVEEHKLYPQVIQQVVHKMLKDASHEKTALTP